jgi:hypothetical protein
MVGSLFHSPAALFGGEGPPVILSWAPQLVRTSRNRIGCPCREYKPDPSAVKSVGILTVPSRPPKSNGPDQMIVSIVYIEFIRQICKPWNQRSEMCNSRISSVPGQDPTRSVWGRQNPTHQSTSLPITRHGTVAVGRSARGHQMGNCSPETCPSRQPERRSGLSEPSFNLFTAKAARPSNHSMGRDLSALYGVQTGSGAQPASVRWVSGGSISELKLTTHRHPVPR